MNCSICKRKVNPTLHTREGYEIDAYRLYTGEVVPVSVKDEKDEEIKFLKLERPRIVVICRNCLDKPDVKGAYDNFQIPPSLA